MLAFSYIIFTFIINFAAYSYASVMFTPDEQTYIENKKTLIIGVVDANEPYSFLRKGIIKGSSVEVIKQIESITGLKFEFRIGSWPDLYKSFIENKIDVIDGITYTEERSAKISFTQPYHIREIKVFMRGDTVPAVFNGITDLKGKTVGIIKNIYYHNALTKHKDVNFLEYNDYPSLMKALAFGWVDAVISSELTGLYNSRENNLSNIIVAGPIGLKEIENEDFRLGVLKTKPILHSILSKALDSIPHEDLRSIEQFWMNNTEFANKTDNEISFTDDEIQFIKTTPYVSIGMLMDYEPFTYESNGEIKGYTKSLLDILSKRTGLTFKYESGSWSSLFNRFKMGKIDSIANISYTQERADFTLYTDEYYRIPTVVFVKNSFENYSGITSLIGKKVGITRDVFFKTQVSALMKGKVIEFDTHDEMMKELSFGELDAVVTALNTGNNIIKRDALVNIVIAGEFDYPGVETEDLRFGIKPELPLLHSIMNKGLKFITNEERIALEDKWLTAKSNDIDPKIVFFSNEEKEYLRNKGTINVCVDPNWMPFEKLSTSGKHIGISADFFQLFQKQLDNKLEVIPTDTWADSLIMAKSRQCDILALAMKTPDRDKYLNFTDPYLVIPNVIATSVNHPFIENIEDVLDSPIGSVKGYAVTEILKHKYPKINLVEVNNDQEGISMLQRGDISEYIGTMASIGYIIQQQRIVDVKISGKLDNDMLLGIAVRNDEPLLLSVFQKIVSPVSDEEKKSILNKWMSVKYDQGFNYNLFWKIIALVLVFAFMMLYWSNKLRKLNVELQKANHKLQNLSERDGLTGLYNRRYFSLHGEHTFSICKRNNIRFSIAVIDIDHFKNLNDTYGHLMGDECLKRLSSMLQTHFQRQSDTVVRYGGEEFAVFSASSEEDELPNAIEAIRHEIETTHTEYNGIKSKMTISGGIYSSIPKQGETMEEYLSKADKALYEAKNSGRNRIVRDINV